MDVETVQNIKMEEEESNGLEMNNEMAAVNEDGTAIVKMEVDTEIKTEIKLEPVVVVKKKRRNMFDVKPEGKIYQFYFQL